MFYKSIIILVNIFLFTAKVKGDHCTICLDEDSLPMPNKVALPDGTTCLELAMEASFFKATDNICLEKYRLVGFAACGCAPPADDEMPLEQNECDLCYDGQSAPIGDSLFPEWLGTTCAQVQEYTRRFYRGSKICLNYQLGGAVHCGCPSRPENGACSLCPNGESTPFPNKKYPIDQNSIPQFGWADNKVYAETCGELEIGTSVFREEKDEKACSTNQYIGGLYCGCDYPIPEEPVCKLCAYEDAVLVTPNALVSSNGSSDLTCAQMELILAVDIDNAYRTEAKCSAKQKELMSACECRAPTNTPSFEPSMVPSTWPSSSPSLLPSLNPSLSMSPTVTGMPSAQPSTSPSSNPSSNPTSTPSKLPSSQPSPKPSSTPSTSPSSVPTISSKPSNEPTLMPSTSPTVTPSSFPSTQPSISSSPTMECLDKFNYSYNTEEKTCSWIAEQEWRRNWLCVVDEVKMNCPQTCGLCCRDNTKFEFYPGGKTRNCAWVAKYGGSKNEYCNWANVKRNCAVACDLCFDKVPTQSPTANPTTQTTLMTTSFASSDFCKNILKGVVPNLPPNVEYIKGIEYDLDVIVSDSASLNDVLNNLQNALTRITSAATQGCLGNELTPDSSDSDKKIEYVQFLGLQTLGGSFSCKNAPSTEGVSCFPAKGFIDVALTSISSRNMRNLSTSSEISYIMETLEKLFEGDYFADIEGMEGVATFEGTRNANGIESLDSSSSSSNVGLIAGVTVGGLVAIGVAFVLFRRRKNSNYEHETLPFPIMSPHLVRSDDSVSRNPVSILSGGLMQDDIEVISSKYSSSDIDDDRIEFESLNGSRVYGVSGSIRRDNSDEFGPSYLPDGLIRENSSVSYPDTVEI